MTASFEALLQTARIKQVPKGQIILYEGDLPQEVFVLQEGIVKVHDIDEQGNEKVLHLVKPTGVVPFIFFSGSETPTRWFYTALTDCALYVLPIEPLRQLMRKDGNVTLALMQWFSDEVHELLTRLSSLSKTNARDKVAAALAFLVNCHATLRRNGWWRVTFPVNHQLLADMAGITRESTAVVMKELQDEKIIRNPRLTVLEIQKEALLN